MSNEEIILLISRLGIAFVFFYAAISSFLFPNNWIGYFPHFLRNIFPAQILLIGFSLYEVILGFWLLSGKYIFWSGIVAAATLFGIIVFNFGVLDIVFRDVDILVSAIVITLLGRRKAN